MRVERTECKNGHPYVEGSFIWAPGSGVGSRYRKCMICQRAHQAAWRRGETKNWRRRTTAENLDAAIIAYVTTKESLRKIEKRLNVPDMTLYRELARRKISRRRQGWEYVLEDNHWKAAKKKSLCWWCGCVLRERRLKTCGKDECRRQAGLPVRWSEEENRKIASMKAAGVSRKAAALEFPERSYWAVCQRMKAA